MKDSSELSVNYTVALWKVGIGKTLLHPPFMDFLNQKAVIFLILQIALQVSHCRVFVHSGSLWYCVWTQTTMQKTHFQIFKLCPFCPFSESFFGIFSAGNTISHLYLHDIWFKYNIIIILFFPFRKRKHFLRQNIYFFNVPYLMGKILAIIQV